MAAREGGEDDRISRSMILACRVLAREPTRISNKRIDMSETYLRWYAAIQKRTAVAAVLDFTDEEWESLKTLREADGAERNMVADDIIGALGMENETIEGTIDEGAV
jgi:hypothetical protein